MRRDGSTFPVAYNATPLRDDGLRGAVIVFEDTTDRAAAQCGSNANSKSWPGWVAFVTRLTTDPSSCTPSRLSTSRRARYIQHELLIRMVTGDGEVIPPDQFFPRPKSSASSPRSIGG